MRRRRLSDESGFSLIELMIVVAIIALLMAIAIPLFLGMRTRAQDTGARASAALAIRTAKGTLDDRENYASTTPASLGVMEPSLTFVDGGTPSTRKTMVSTDVPDIAGSALVHVVAVYSESGKCFYVRDQADQETTYAVRDPSSAASCMAQATGDVTFTSRW